MVAPQASVREALRTHDESRCFRICTPQQRYAISGRCQITSFRNRGLSRRLEHRQHLLCRRAGHGGNTRICCANRWARPGPRHPMPGAEPLPISAPLSRLIFRWVPRVASVGATVRRRRRRCADLHSHCRTRRCCLRAVFVLVRCQPEQPPIEVTLRGESHKRLSDEHRPMSARPSLASARMAPDRGQAPLSRGASWGDLGPHRPGYAPKIGGLPDTAGPSRPR